MTVLPITIWGEPVLHRRAAEVEVFDDEQIGRAHV